MSGQLPAHVFTFGETMGLFHATELGALAHVGSARISTGGADSNVAIGLSRLGVPAVWLGRVGADGLGRRVMRDIRGEGVDVRAIIDEDAATGLMVKEKPSPQHTRVWFYRSGSAGSRLCQADVDPLLVEKAALAHVTGITASLSSSARETVAHVLELARAAAVPVSFDVNHRGALWRRGDPVPVYREIASAADIVFASADEAALLTGADEGDVNGLIDGMLALGPSVAVLKRGERGSIASDSTMVFESAALSVPVADTVGAGDAFVSGFLAARLRGGEIADCLRTATAAGAFACMGMGDWESSPRPEDLKLLEDTDPVTR